MHFNIFETNDLQNIYVEEFNGSKIYYMDNFYKHPEAVLSLLFEKKPGLWKEHESPSFNGIHFFDMRHNFNYSPFYKTGIELSNICGQSSESLGTIKTNFTKLIDKEFNNYENNYWSPHFDLGFTAIIYLNTVGSKTNLYEQIEEDRWNGTEHSEPWRLKQKYNIIKQLDGKFNRLIMFDGARFLHGMDISSDDFFKIYRMNQVLFFR
jgi:hypothetical protein